MSVLVSAAAGDPFALALVAGIACAISATFLWPIDGPTPRETP